MIRTIYSSQKLWKGYHVFWCILVFLVNSLAFWYIVLKCCFGPLCPRPPIPVTAVGLTLILVDRLYPILIRSKLTWILPVDLGIWVLLLLSLVLPDENKVCFMGLAVTLNLLDIIYLKQLMFDLVRRKYGLYKFYIILKIVYWILIYGHVIGCIFYAIDIYLINHQTLGPLAQNPGVYYHGTLLAYTPIYMFENLNRYAYAMYYSFALVSTIAFGDIVGKNYYQDIYVGILIILSTIVISLIIEQMFIIFRRKKTKFLELLNRVRFLSERLKGYQQIPKTFRLQIINYLIETNWRYLSEYPLELQTSKQFKIKILTESIISNPDLPTFYSKYILHKLKLKHLPKGIQMNSNVPQRQELNSFLISKGVFWVGYTTRSGRLVGGDTIEKDGMNFGIQEALVGTNDLYRFLAVRTITSGVVLTISKQEIHQILEQLNIIDFPCEKPIEHYQLAKDRAMFKRHKYECHICKTKTHTLLNCSKCHYIVDEGRVLEIAKSQNRRKARMRRYRKSFKIIGKIQEQLGQPLQTSEGIETKERSWRLMELRRFREIFNKIAAINREQKEKAFQKWHRWDFYGQDLLPYGYSDDVALEHEHYLRDYQSMILTVPSPSRLNRSLIQ